MRQWLKKARVTFSTGGLVINPGNDTQDQLRVEFRVRKAISSTANAAEIHLWNLSESTRNAVGKELDNIILEAGYTDMGGNVGIIFSGQVRDVEHVIYPRQGIDTLIYCGDADKAFRKSIVTRTFPKGSTADKISEAIYEEFSKEGVEKGEWQFPQNMKTYERPYSVCGPAVREMDVLGRTNKFYWSVQNGAMEIVPANGFLPGTVYISESTGMVGIPTITDNGVKVTCKINPEIRPNRTITVASKQLRLNAVSGIYRVGSVEYFGDNRDGPFDVNIHAEAVQSGNQVDEGIQVRKALPV